LFTQCEATIQWTFHWN